MRSHLEFLDQRPGERAPSKDQHALALVTKAPDTMTQAQSEQEGDNDREAHYQEASVKQYSGGKAVEDAQQMDALSPLGSCCPEPCHFSRSFCPTVNLPVVTLNSVNPPKRMRNFPERWLQRSPQVAELPDGPLCLEQLSPGCLMRLNPSPRGWFYRLRATQTPGQALTA